MTKEQFKRANGLVFKILMVIMCYLEFTFLGAFLAGTRSSRLLAQIVVVLLFIIVAIITNIKYKDNKFGKMLLQYSVTIAFSVCLSCNRYMAIYHSNYCCFADIFGCKKCDYSECYFVCYEFPSVIYSR